MIKRPAKCSGRIKPVPHLNRSSRGCSRNASVWRDGKPYCKIHDPQYKRKKRKPKPKDQTAERYNYLAGRLLRRHGFTIDDLVWNQIKIERLGE